MICKKLFKRIPDSCFRRVHIKFLYNSKFDFTAKSLVTNTVVITRVLCIHIYQKWTSKQVHDKIPLGKQGWITTELIRCWFNLLCCWARPCNVSWVAGWTRLVYLSYFSIKLGSSICTDLLPGLCPLFNHSLEDITRSRSARAQWWLLIPNWHVLFLKINFKKIERQLELYLPLIIHYGLMNFV